LVDTRRHLKKQLAILENLKSHRDISQDIDALTDPSKKFTQSSEEHLAMDLSELSQYNEEERQIHVKILKDELDKVRSQILPFNELMLEYFEKRKDKCRSTQQNTM